MTEQELRALGIPQLTAHHARSCLAAQAIRAAALEALLTDADDHPRVKAVVLALCHLHPDAGWWLRHQPGICVPAAAHWANVFGEEMRMKGRDQ